MPRNQQFSANSPKPNEILSLWESKVHQSEIHNFTHELGIDFVRGRSQRHNDQAHGPQMFDVGNQLTSAGKEKLLEDSVRLGHFEMSTVRKAKIKNSSLHLFSLL